jgi:hypothetical protein
MSTAQCLSSLSMSQASEFRTLLGLSIALDHPDLSSSPQVLCAAARAWREAVQQCKACNTYVRLISSAHSQLQQRTSFSNWLHNHAGLVRSISIHTRPRQFRRSLFGQPGQDCVAELLLQRTMQLLSAAPHGLSVEGAAAPAPAPAPVTAASPAATAAAAAGATSQTCTQQQQQQCWRLVSYSSDCYVSPATLAALPAHSLTHLDLDPACVARTSAAAACRYSAALTVLTRLSNLQQLRFRVSHRISGGFLTSVAQLTRLTSLTLHGAWWRSQ